jgi:hypothetical protein
MFLCGVIAPLAARWRQPFGRRLTLSAAEKHGIPVLQSGLLVVLVLFMHEAANEQPSF